MQAPDTHARRASTAKMENAEMTVEILDGLAMVFSS
jgi:hypothetical protein